MSTFILALMMLAVVIAVALIWKNREEFPESDLEEPAEDVRVSPLLRGINYLLSDMPDRALQEMVQVARIRSESAEVYMALGEMFRTQGEYGRAVRIHQNILARPDVPNDLHFQAHVSLGRDFQAGGLLDRALKSYSKALAMQTDHLESLNACLRIREQSHEWDEAEWLVSRLEQVEHVSYHEHRAYLKSEMAEAALKKGDSALSESLTIEALKLAPSCTHAHLLRIKHHIMGKDSQNALEQAALFLDDTKTEHHVLLPSALLIDQEFYTEKGHEFLWNTWLKGQDIELAVSWIEDVTRVIDVSAGRALKDKMVLKHLNLRHELRLTALVPTEDNLVKQAKKWRLKMKLYACTHCGVQVHQMRWHCPKCNKWGSMEPIQDAQVLGEELRA